MSNLYVAAMMESKVVPGMITRESMFKGIQFVLVEKLGEKFRTLNFLDEIIDEGEAEGLWTEAIKNTRDVAVVKDLYGILKDLGVEDVREDSSETLVLTTKYQTLGAGALICEDVVDFVVKSCGWEAIMLPSSIHECLFIPAVGYDFQIDDCTSMVKQVNREEVSPNEWLADKAYQIRRNFPIPGEEKFTVYEGGESK